MKNRTKLLGKVVVVLVTTAQFLSGAWVTLDREVYYTTEGRMAYLDGRWVSWGEGEIYRSPDLREWTAIDVPHHWSVSDVFFQNGTWMVLDYIRSNKSSVSNDLENWEEKEFTGVNETISLTGYRHNFYWAKQSQGIRWYRSVDGVEWQQLVDPFRSSNIAMHENGSEIHEEDLNLGISNKIIHEGHITLFQNDPSQNGGIGNLAYTLDGIHWEVVRLELQDGTVWISPTIDSVSLNIIVQYAQGAKLYRGALYRADKDNLVRIDSQGAEHELNLFRLNGIEADRDERFVKVFRSSSRLYVGTSHGKIFESSDGINWAVRVTQPKMLVNEYIHHEDTILISSWIGGDQYLLEPDSTTFELVSKPTPKYANEIIVSDNGWYQHNSYGVISSKDGLNWNWLLDIETGSGEFSGNDLRMDQLTKSDDGWIAHGISSIGDWRTDDDYYIQRIAWRSEDSERWEALPVTLGGEPMTDWTNGFFYGNGKWLSFLGYGQDSELIASDDGIHFEKVGDLDRSLGSEEIAFFKEYFIDCREGQFWYSEDGVSWEMATYEVIESGFINLDRNEFHEVSDELYAFNGFTLWRTKDGENWQQLPSPLENGAGYTRGFGHFINWHKQLFFSCAGELFVLDKGKQWMKSKALPNTVSGTIQDPNSDELWLIAGDKLMADESVLGHPQVTIEKVDEHNFVEGQDQDRAVFSVKRTGDTSVSLDVDLQFFGSAKPGVDFSHNVDRKDDHFVLHFGEGFSELHIHLSTFADNEDEYGESIGFELLRSDRYEILDLWKAYSSIVVYDP